MAVPHSLMRIKGSLLNTPHLIEQNSFNNILSYVDSRVKGDAVLSTPEMLTRDDMAGNFESRFDKASKLGVMEISGPLTYRTSGWEAMCGGTSYEMLKDQMEYFVAKGAKTVAMFVDSGGGQAHGMIDSANYIRQLANDNGIKIVAFVDGMSASAAYGISCMADEIVMTSDSQVGSIGVLIQLYNDSKYLEKQGYERTFITAGKDKVPFAKDGSFTDAFIEGLQEQVDELYEGFTGHVATHRKIGIDAVKGTEANVFMAKDAVKLGLADQVMTAEEFSDYIGKYAMTHAQGKDVNPLKKLMNTQQEEPNMSRETELSDLLAKATAQLEAQSATATAQAEALASVQGQVAALTAQLDAANAAVAEAAQAQADAALAQRKAQLAEVLPSDQVDAKLTAFATLDQATFDFMVGELQAAKDARAASFAPVGSEAEPEVPEEPSAHASLLAAGVAAAKALHR